MAEEKTQIYHETQRLQFCLLHSLNNLFQEKDAFTRVNLDAIAEKLVLDDPNKGTWTPLSVFFKPHHNSLTGNYDINVLIAAIEGKGKSVIWHDRRKGASSIDLDGPDDKLLGIVLNVPVRKYVGLWRSRHWVTLRRIEGVWYNLDSDFVAPYSFNSTEEVCEYLDSVIHCGAEVLLVMNDKHWNIISIQIQTTRFQRLLGTLVIKGAEWRMPVLDKTYKEVVLYMLVGDHGSNFELSASTDSNGDRSLKISTESYLEWGCNCHLSKVYWLV